MGRTELWEQQKGRACLGRFVEIAWSMRLAGLHNFIRFKGRWMVFGP